MNRQKSLIRVIGEPLLVAVLLALAVRTVVRIHAVPSDSMAPALQAGDRIAVTTLPGDEPVRGDVIVFRDPFTPGQLSVKRVVGLPGDLVETAEGRIRISGRPVTEPYGVAGSDLTIPPQVVPTGHLFVLGDNRPASYDSRHWGPLPSGLVTGRARMVLWHGGDRGRIFKWIR